MIMSEFYRQKLRKIEENILKAEGNGDFKTVAKLQGEKVEIEKRIGKIEGKS